MKGLVGISLVVFGMIAVIASAVGGFLTGIMLMTWSNRQDEERKRTASMENLKQRLVQDEGKEEAKVGPTPITFPQPTAPIPSWGAGTLPPR